MQAALQSTIFPFQNLSRTPGEREHVNSLSNIESWRAFNWHCCRAAYRFLKFTRDM